MQIASVKRVRAFVNDSVFPDEDWSLDIEEEPFHVLPSDQDAALYRRSENDPMQHCVLDFRFYKSVTLCPSQSVARSTNGFIKKAFIDEKRINILRRSEERERYPSVRHNRFATAIG